jgi:hypothetical protein
MANQRRGLPDTFKLDISQAAITERPVELGDYLDEETAPAPAKPAKPPLQVLPDPRPATPAPAAVGGSQAAEPVPTPARSPEPRPSPQVRQPVPKPKPRQAVSVPRKQVNMNPETLAMVEQLLDFCQTYSVQKDLKASEVFHGLVLALFEAREHLDLSRVQPRGRWGTPTAAALPIALKNAFQKAVRDYHVVQNG